jgi:hypothetical protein
MSSLKDLEAAFESELNLASCRLEALGWIKIAVEKVTALGFPVEVNPTVYSVGELVDVTFQLDAFDSKIEATFIADEAAPDFTVVDDFIGVLEDSVDVAVPLSSVQADVPAFVPDTPEEEAAKDAQPDPDLLPSPIDGPLPAKPQAAPSAVKPGYHDRYADLKPGKAPLTDEDVATIRRMSAEKAESGAIAEALGRDPRGFYHIINRVMASAPPKQVPAKGVPQAVFHSASAVPVAEVAATVPVPAAPLQETRIRNAVDAPPLGSLNDAEKRLDARLDAIGNKGKFADPADDLFLVENLAKGIKLAHVAADLAIDVGVCKQRFEMLVPTKSPQEQAEVAKALRRRAIAARARAA